MLAVIKNCKELDYKVLDKTLRDIQYLTCKASNRAMQMYYKWEHEKIEHKNKHGIYPVDKEMFGKTYRAVVEAEMKAIMNTVNTANVSQTNSFIHDKWKADKKDILNYRKSVASFKLDMPVYLKNSSYKVSQGNNGFEITCSLFNRAYQKENDIKQLTFTLEKLDGNKKATLNKIMSGIYKQGSMQIVKNRKNKWCLLISFGFEAEEKGLDPNRIVGVDVGITNALTMQIWDNNLQEWDRLAWRNCILDGKELIHYRQKIEARRIALLRNSKIAEESTGKAGHGRTTRIKAIDHLSEKTKNFRDTLNHKYSKYVVDFAVKNNCGSIQMEDLSGYSEGVSETFLKNWSYYDLQQKIQYKADEVGIAVNFIDPQYTSLRCSQCGNIHKENRDCKNNQAKFECVKCGHKENADINASKNIALPNIEDIINEQFTK